MSTAAGTLRVRRAGPEDRTAWDAYVRARPEADPLQGWAWGEVTAPEGEMPLRLLAEGPSGVRGVAQALVRRTLAGRAVLYVPHGPLWDRDVSDAAHVLARLVEALREAARETRGILVLVDPRAVPERPDEAADIAAALSGLGFRRARHDLQARTTRLVDLRGGDEALEARWHPDARRRARRAAREGVTTTIDRRGDTAAVARFHELLLATGERGAFRVRSAEALQRLARASAEGDGWYLVLAWKDGRPIAGIACPRLADRGYYFYAASRRDEDLTHAYGGYATMAALMHALHADGATSLDLWGVLEEGHEGEEPGWGGFSQFKRKFGGLPLEHPGTFELIVDPFWYRLRDLRERLAGGA